MPFFNPAPTVDETKPHRRGIDIVAEDLKAGLLPWQIAQKHRVPLHRIYFFERLMKERRSLPEHKSHIF